MAQLINAPSSGDGYISGYFGIIDLSEDMVENLIMEIDQAIGTATSSSQASLRSEASADSAWQDISPFLYAEAERGVVSISYPEALDSLVTETEYGTPDVPPSPLLRLSIQGVADYASKQSSAALAKGVPLA